MKKTNLFFFAIALMATIFVSCGQKGGSTENAGSPQEQLTGEWKIIKAEGSMASLNEGTSYNFMDDNKFSTKLGIIETKGTLSAKTDSTFSVMFEGMTSDFVYNYRFEGGKLIVELQNSGQIFTMEKQ